MTYLSSFSPHTRTTLGVCGVVLLALLVLAEPSLAAPAAGGGGGGGGGPIVETFRNLRLTVEESGQQLFIVALVVGAVVIAIWTKGSLPKIGAFLFIMIVLSPIVASPSSLVETLARMGNSIWPTQ